MDGFCIQPLPHALEVSGSTGPTDDDGFSGVAIALGWWPVGPASIPPDPLYLVSDPTRSAPLWVSSAELSDNSYRPIG
jgi:hypothetical protein